MADYKISYSLTRARRGLKPFAVMEIVDPEFSRGVSQHKTQEEADAALEELKAKERE